MSSAELSLPEQIEELLQFVYLMPVAIVKLGAAGEVQMMNPKAVQLLEDLDLNPGALNGPTLMDFLSPGLSAIWQAAAQELGQVCPPLQLQLQSSGAARHLVLSLIRTDARCTMLSLEDVSATVAQQQEMARQQQRFGAVMEHIEGYCVVMLDAQGSMLEWNPSIGRMFGPETAERVGQSVDKLLAPVSEGDRRAMVFEKVKTAIAQSGAFRSKTAFRNPAGLLAWGDLVVTPTVESNGSISGYVLVIRDVTEAHEAQQRLLSDAMTDPLTGLLNRRGLAHKVQLWLDAHGGEAPGPASWIMADIDHFKHVNDTYGHDTGDVVLKSVAQLLREAMRDGDVIARLGGEEFLLLLRGADLPAALNAAERMRHKIEQATMGSGAIRFNITTSFGVVGHRADLPWNSLVNAADGALSQAKTTGRNRVVAGQVSDAELEAV